MSIPRMETDGKLFKFLYAAHIRCAEVYRKRQQTPPVIDEIVTKYIN